MNQVESNQKRLNPLPTFPPKVRSTTKRSSPSAESKGRQGRSRRNPNAGHSHQKTGHRNFIW